MKPTFLIGVCVIGSAIVTSDPAAVRAHAQSVAPVPGAPTVIAAPPAQRSNGNDPVFRAAVDLVSLNVVVTDGQQRFVGGLEEKDFSILEDGVAQEIAFFAAADVPIDLAILLDTSASMSDKMQTMQQAAVGFASTLRPTDRVMVVDIKDASRVLYGLAAPGPDALDTIRTTRASGGTALYNGLYLGLKAFVSDRRNLPQVRRQAIVVLSDGDDTASLVSFDDVLEVARQSNVAIYTITLKSAFAARQAAAATGTRYFSPSEYSMRSLATETGGRAFFPLHISELAGLYSSIAQELASEYSIGYSSTNRDRDGGLRRVLVRIVDRPGVRTRTRTTYLAARASRHGS